MNNTYQKVCFSFFIFYTKNHHRNICTVFLTYVIHGPLCCVYPRTTIVHLSEQNQFYYEYNNNIFIFVKWKYGIFNNIDQRLHGFRFGCFDMVVFVCNMFKPIV